MPWLSFFIFLLTTLQILGHEQLTSPEETNELLQEIKEYAIVLGDGEKEVHSFIDPKCSMSQRYLQYLFKREKQMFGRYKIYLYLYELKRKNSKNIIRNIFDSEYPNILLKAFMVSKLSGLEYLEEELDDPDIDSQIEAIEEVAREIGVYKRPYIITNGRGK
ncbi:hypothetical protein ThvES_00001990 [Thiovulum sp. ES]|nr:hypothetical protein ThvES_00001990 [Thiovulum sp. ES]